MPVLKLFWSALTILMLCGSGAVRAESAEQLFARFEPALLQIRVLDQASGAKAAIGTGFLLAEPALLVTNYHVISEAVLYPAKHRLEYLNSAQQKGELKVLAVDVINDLALLSTDYRADYAFHYLFAGESARPRHDPGARDLQRPAKIQLLSAHPFYRLC